MPLKVRQEDKEILRKRIQQQHLDLLRPGHACLISDIEERVLNRDNRIISSKRLLYAELPEDIHREEWTWTFVARGEYNPKHRTEMMVRAIRL